MGTKRIPGLVKRKGVWHIDKVIQGRRLCESTGTSEIQEAEQILALRIDQVRQHVLFGVRPMRTFREAATKFLNEETKDSVARDAQDIRALDPYIGHLPIQRIHMGTLAPFIEARRKQGRAASTVNRSLTVAGLILNKAAGLWRDEEGLSWLERPPIIQKVKWGEARPAYPISWDEQAELFRYLPDHLAKMVLFKLNTGLREGEVVNLRWDWEIEVPELNTSVFIVPGPYTKNREDRLVVLNKVARSVVDGQRGVHEDAVFTYRGRPVTKIYNSAWKRARKKAGLPDLRVHDLRHTFGRRLRAARVPEATWKVLLGHKNGDITTHYCAPEIEELIEAVERLCETTSRKSPALVILRSRAAAARA